MRQQAEEMAMRQRALEEAQRQAQAQAQAQQQAQQQAAEEMARRQAALAEQQQQQQQMLSGLPPVTAGSNAAGNALLSLLQGTPTPLSAGGAGSVPVANNSAPGAAAGAELV